MSITACDNSIPLSEREIPAESPTPLYRSIEMDSIRNFRDMGGYLVGEGQQMAWGKIYRSASLYESSELDIEFMVKRLGIKTIIDFRNHREVELEPEPVKLIKQVKHVWIPIEVKGAARDDIVERLQNARPDDELSQLLIEVNQKLVNDHLEEMRAWFNVLLNEEGPFLFHCTEGKDRTGFAAAMLMYILGVESDHIFDDYLLTNKVNKLSIEERIKASRVLSAFQVDTQQLKQLLVADESYLQAGFDEAFEQYGSLDAYVADGLLLGPEEVARLKLKFLIAL